MKRAGFFALAFLLGAIWAPCASAQVKPGENPPLVGRISFIDGQLLRYVYAEKDWVATVKDAPFGTDDALYSNDTGKAEFKLPNGTWLRVGGDTQVQLLALRNDATEIDVASGTTRFYNKNRDAVIKATTPFGYVVARPGTAFDLYVGDGSVEVISLDGVVEFAVEGGAKYPIEAGGASILSDGKQVVEGDGTVDTAWDDWNLSREQLWTQRVQVKGESVQFLPPALQSDAYDLDRNGRWERVYYQGEYRTLWRPVSVAPDWQPFTVGRWTVWREDNVWIPEEEYGYVTHHYGNWVYVDSYRAWYWAPPVTVKVGYLGGCACWYPGRVAWIHTGIDIGWVPLAPAEIYYSHHHWGPGAVFAGVNPAGIRIDLGGLAYLNRAVIVDQSHFYAVNNYTSVRITNISQTTIVNHYRAAPVVSNAVMANYSTMRNRFVYNTNMARIDAKPHQAVVARIDQNRALAARQAGAVSARSIEHGMAGMKQAAPLRGPQAAQVQKPQLSGKIVPESQANRPRSEVKFEERVLKSQTRSPRAVQGRPAGMPATGAPAVKGPRPPKPPRQSVQAPQSRSERAVQPPRSSVKRPPQAGGQGIVQGREGPQRSADPRLQQRPQRPERGSRQVQKPATRGLGQVQQQRQRAPQELRGMQRQPSIQRGMPPGRSSFGRRSPDAESTVWRAEAGARRRTSARPAEVSKGGGAMSI